MFLVRHHATPFKCAGGALMLLAVADLEAWLRIPFGPLLDGYLQAAASRA